MAIKQGSTTIISDTRGISLLNGVSNTAHSEFWSTDGLNSTSVFESGLDTECFPPGNVFDEVESGVLRKSSAISVAPTEGSRYDTSPDIKFCVPVNATFTIRMTGRWDAPALAHGRGYYKFYRFRNNSRTLVLDQYPSFTYYSASWATITASAGDIFVFNMHSVAYAGSPGTAVTSKLKKLELLVSSSSPRIPVVLL